MPPRSNSLTLIIASAGSGKTQSIAQKALLALEKGDPVLAITFTRKAAAELRSRILYLATQDTTPEPLIKNLLFEDFLLETGTIDSLIRRIYQHIAPFLFLPIYRELIVEEAALLQAQEQLLKHLWRKLSEKRHYITLQKALREHDTSQTFSLSRTFRKAIETLLSQGPIRIRILKGLLHTPPSSFASPVVKSIFKNATSAASQFLPEFLTKELYTVLEHILRSYRQDNRTLFLKDLQYVVELTARNIPEFTVLPYRHIRQLLVDEAQDTSLQQWAILEPLMEELQSQGRPIYIVGDPKQNIYNWREADLSYFLDLRQKAYQELLSHNYRSQRRIISFNNRFYDRVSRYFGFLSSKESLKKCYHEIVTSQYLIEVYRQHRQRKGRRVRPFRSDLSLRKRWLYPTVRVCGYPSEEALAKLLRHRLKILRWANIPPGETAFLVRKNDEINLLRRLLPEYDLQITSSPLEKVPSLYATMELLTLHSRNPLALRTSPPPASRQFLEHHGLYAELENIFLNHPPECTPIYWWKAFYAFMEHIRSHLPSEVLFWQVFLDNLWSFLEGLAAPGLEEILSWWEGKASRLTVEVPLGPDTYPVLTIHKAKGLAWEVVIVPFANWNLLHYKAKKEWSTVKKIERFMKLSSQDTHELIEHLNSLLEISATFRISYNPELPLLVRSTDKPLQPLYAESWKAAALEALNLHYVATTRPRRALFIYYRTNKNKASDSFPAEWNELHQRFQKQRV